jgi:predicted Ser/Thr protein kinase
MSLAAGSKLGPYKILAPIGEGGMGEVYRARDTKLKREVAIKVLPDPFAGDPGRMLRFQREAEVLASLNHPNIAHIYGVEERALVMELVDGETLPAALPVETALRYARQIAEALEYAHERGVIHRDLKPANIKVTPEGTVKLLDFGLAKAVEDPAAPGDDPANSPTLTLGATRVGVILGTAAYMSPEQASGKTVDRRADIWSFGAVLYEMLSGKRAFEGESASDTLASVLKLNPDFSALPKETPSSIAKLLRRCLTKDRKQRLQAIGEARIALESPVAEEPVPRSVRPRLGIVATIAAGAMVVVAAVLGWIAWRATRPVDHSLVRLDVDLGPEVGLPPVGGESGSSVILASDGTRLAYLASVAGGPRKLFTKRLDQPKAIELPGTEGASGLFFSPDGQWIGFSAGDKLNKISVEGGAIVPLGQALTFAGGSWGEDGSIIVGRALTKGMERIPPGGGAPTTVTELGSGEIAHVAPQILPGGKFVLFEAARGADLENPSIEVISLADRRRKTVARGSGARYLPSGHLIYSNKGTLFAIPFDLDKLETYGNAVPVLDHMAYSAAAAYSDFDVSRAGTFVFRAGGGAGPTGAITTVQWLDDAGKREPLLAKPGVYRNPRLSPDGKRLALSVQEGGKPPDVWVYDQQRDAMQRLTFSGGPYDVPIWSPDGRYVVFISLSGGMAWTRSDGAGQPQPLMQVKNLQLPSSFAPDGKRLAYIELSQSAAPQIWTVPIEDDGGQLKAGKPEQFLQSQFADSNPAFSLDGRWLAYESNESGKTEVYVRPFPPPASGQGGKWLISNGGQGLPHWLRNGRDILYRAGDGIMAVSYSVKGDSFVAEKPRVWLAKLGGTDWDLAPDGKRVAVIMPAAAPEAPKLDHEVTFLFNFFDELRRRVPTGK